MFRTFSHMKNTMKNKIVKTSFIRDSVASYASNSSDLKRETGDSSDFQFDRDHKPLAFGIQASFVYDATSGKYLEMENSIADITGISANEIIEKDAVFFLCETLLDEYLEPLNKLAQQSSLLSKKYRDAEDLTINLEYSIHTRNQASKRLLCQYRPIKFNAAGYPVLNKGSYIDITHLRKEGLPFLYVIANNKLVECEYANADYLIKNKSLPFTTKEIDVLKLTSQGHSIKEIALQLNISISTVYTHRKNIKTRTDKDLFQIIQELRSKGIL